MTEKTKTMLLVLTKRWARVFVAGAVAQLLVVLLATDVGAVLGDPERWLWGTLVAFAAGGVAALDKRLRWKE